MPLTLADALRYLAWAVIVALLAILALPTLIFQVIADAGLWVSERLADAAEAVRP